MTLGWKALGRLFFLTKDFKKNLKQKLTLAIMVTANPYLQLFFWLNLSKIWTRGEKLWFKEICIDFQIWSKTGFKVTANPSPTSTLYVKYDPDKAKGREHMIWKWIFLTRSDMALTFDFAQGHCILWLKALFR